MCASEHSFCWKLFSTEGSHDHQNSRTYILILPSAGPRVFTRWASQWSFNVRPMSARRTHVTNIKLKMQEINQGKEKNENQEKGTPRSHRNRGIYAKIKDPNKVKKKDPHIHLFFVLLPPCMYKHKKVSNTHHNGYISAFCTSTQTSFPCKVYFPRNLFSKFSLTSDIIVNWEETVVSWILILR